MKPGLILTDPPLTGHVCRSLHRASRVATIPLRTHPAATTPVESSSALFARFPDDRNLPRFVAGSASTSALSGPARRSLSLRSACSPDHLCDPLHRRLRPLRFLHDRSDCYRLERKLPGGTASHWGIAPFHGAPQLRHTKSELDTISAHLGSLGQGKSGVTAAAI